MPADIVTTQTALIDTVAVTVETKATLDPADAWTTQPHLYADRLTTRVNGVDRCQLSFLAGAAVRQFGETAFAKHDPLDLIGQYIRVTAATTPQLQWHGVITADATERRGVINDQLAGGKQTIIAEGLEYLLGRTQVDSAVIFDEVRLLRPLGFNTGSIAPTSNQQQRGNRHAALSSNNLPVFESGAAAATDWKADQIVEHLLAFHAPVDSAGSAAPVKWSLSVDGTLALSNYTPTVRAEGRSLFELLNTIANPRRGFCWWVEYDPAGDGGSGEIVVHVQTVFATGQTLPGGGSVPANNDQLTIDFDADPTVAGARVDRSGNQRYDRILVRGARMTSTLTVGVEDGTLVEDWSTDQETDYKAGAGGSDGEANDAARRSPRLDRVYSAFRIPPSWDIQSGDGGTATRSFAFPELSVNGSVLGSLDIRPQGLRPLATTRMQLGWDYSDPNNPATDDPADAAPEYEPPFAIIKVATSPDRFQFVDRLNDATLGGTPVASGSLTSYHVYGQRHAPGVMLRAAGGVQHTLALNHWSGANATGKNPQLDYDTLRVTLAAEADAFAEGVWPEVLPAGQPIEQLIIDAGDAYRLDFIPANTVVGLDGGDPVLASAPAVLRDDRATLRDLAFLAYEWYQAPRASLSVSWSRLVRFQAAGPQPLGLGAMITAIGDGDLAETINGVVGQIDYQFTGGVSTSLETLRATFSPPDALS